MDDTIRVKLVHSPIGTNDRVRETVRGLGLGRVGSERTLKRSASVLGMLKRIPHLVVEVKDQAAVQDEFTRT
ncbi:MAG: 50S ribosomal protein L30 [Candidatus Binataceae bacterium]